MLESLKIHVDEVERRLEKASADFANKKIEQQERRALALDRFKVAENVRTFEKSVGIFGPKRLANYEAETSDQKRIVEDLTEICKGAAGFKREPFNLHLFGPIGTGKDHLITAVCRAMVASGVTVKYVLGEDFFSHCTDRISRGETDKQFLRKYLEPDILVMSDPIRKKWLPLSSDSRFRCTAFDKFGSIIKQRYLKNKPVWLTANLLGRDWSEGAKRSAELFGPDVWRRIIEKAKIYWTGWPCYSRPEQKIGT